MNILLLDDHIMTIDGYISLLKKEIESFNALTALNCQEAHKILTTTSDINLAILDYQIPEYKEKELFSGVDVAILLKSLHPQCKIVMITAHHEATIIYDIYTKAKPDALVIKSDVSYSTFKDFIITENTYLSSTAQKAITRINTIKELHNDLNRQILYYLKSGFKMNELNNFIPLSESGIKKRVDKMRDAFGVSDINGLIKEATKQNFI